MNRLTAADFSPEVLRAFDSYVHGDLDRRGFIEQAGQLGSCAAGAVASLAALSPDFAAAQQVRANDPRIATRTQAFD